MTGVALDGVEVDIFLGYSMPLLPVKVTIEKEAVLSIIQYGVRRRA